MTPIVRRVLAALLVLFALAWLPLNKPVEGPTLLVLSHRHGVTLADLLSVAAVLLAVWLAWPRRRDRSGRAPFGAALSGPASSGPASSGSAARPASGPVPRAVQGPDQGQTHRPVPPPRRPVPPQDLGSMRTQPVWPIRR